MSYGEVVSIDEFMTLVESDYHEMKDYSKAELKDVISEDSAFSKLLFKKVALTRGLGHGETLKPDWEGYRNSGLVFWDNKKKEIVYPYTFVDDYGSVPPRFVVGNGDFNPTNWLNQVDHNSYVFPSKTLIQEIKTLVSESPSKMIVTINGDNYLIRNPKKLTGDKLDSFVLEVYQGGDGMMAELHMS